MATVTVSDGASIGTLGTVAIAKSGSAEVTVESGATLTTGFFQMSTDASSTSTLMIRGTSSANVPSRVSALANSFIGGLGEATVRIEEGATLDTRGVALGFQLDGRGEVVIDSAIWKNQGNIFIGSVTLPELEILGTGSVILDLAELESTDTIVVALGSFLGGIGVIRGDVETNGGLIGAGISIHKQDADIETLTIEGNLDSIEGIIEITVGGTASGEFSVLEVDGEAFLADTTINFKFVDGFLPQMSDTFPFMVVTGVLTATNTMVDFDGVAEGFELQVKEENGMLFFEALNNAQPTDSPNVDIDGNFTVDAIDVQLVINGALGIDTGEITDVNGNGSTDAIDVQMVINAVLGIAR